MPLFTESDLKKVEESPSEERNDEDGVFLGLFDAVDDGKQSCAKSNTTDEADTDAEVEQ